MTSAAPATGPRWVRVLLAVVAAVTIGAAAYFATVLLVFGLTPTCATAKPPGPPKLDVALFVTAVLAGAGAALVAGRRLGAWRWLFGAVAAAPPAVALGFALTHSLSGFCF